MTSPNENPFLSFRVDGGVATVSFTRPEKSNAYNRTMLHDLCELLARASHDGAIRVLTLRGEGRHFCAGAEIARDDSGAEGGPTIPEVCRQLDNLPKPTLAAVQGACLGGGMALVACCDVAIAERGAFFAMPEVRLGFAPGPLIPFVVNAIGYRHARRLLLSGERFDAEEALRIGLVHRLCEPGEAEAALARALDEIMQAAPGAAGQAKAMTRRLRDEPITPALLTELESAFRASGTSAEAQEGRAAFREKRPPRWTG
jgi:methylglutaconyl-CoA hydratase